MSGEFPKSTKSPERLHSVSLPPRGKQGQCNHAGLTLTPEYEIG